MYFFGDGTTDSAEIGVGQTVDHVYAEGQYNVRIVGTGITGLTTEALIPLTVSFRAPENVQATITPVTGDSFSINLTASADFETFFEVTFGDDPSQLPIQFMEGDPAIVHTYANTGTYTVTIVAYSGGAATTTITEIVTISNPILLPITFENSSLNYSFVDFGNVSTSLVNNPSISGINLSSKVGRTIKNNGADTWGGSTMVIDGNIDFSTLTKIRVKVWSPQVGAIVKLKIENLNDGNINKEVDLPTTVANTWEYLTFDFACVNAGSMFPPKVPPIAQFIIKKKL